MRSRVRASARKHNNCDIDEELDPSCHARLVDESLLYMRFLPPMTFDCSC